MKSREELLSLELGMSNWRGRGKITRLPMANVSPQGLSEAVPPARYIYPQLKALTLSKFAVAESDVNHICQAINFPRLQKLTLLGAQYGHLFSGLAKRFESCFKQGSSVVNLRTLKLGLVPLRSAAALCRLLLSFDTLTELGVEYLCYDGALMDVQPSSDMMMTAILSHKRLKILHLQDTIARADDDTGSPFSCPLSIETVTNVVRALPELRDLRFIADIRRLEQAVSSTLTICPSHSCVVSPQSKDFWPVLQMD
jgi:hypothetical protein